MKSKLKKTVRRQKLCRIRLDLRANGNTLHRDIEGNKTLLVVSNNFFVFC